MGQKGVDWLMHPRRLMHPQLDAEPASTWGDVCRGPRRLGLQCAVLCCRSRAALRCAVLCCAVLTVCAVRLVPACRLC